MKSMKALVTMVLSICCLASFAQDSTKIQVKKEHHKQAATMYCCKMDKGVISDKPGKCPKCGKDLTLTKKEQMKMEVMKMYTCPMHPAETSGKAGKCPKCGMAMTEKKQ